MIKITSEMIEKLLIKRNEIWDRLDENLTALDKKITSDFIEIHYSFFVS
jgi:ABC-type transport system involved in cytochrome c biogenesis ATPase subunit